MTLKKKGGGHESEPLSKSGSSETAIHDAPIPTPTPVGALASGHTTGAPYGNPRTRGGRSNPATRAAANPAAKSLSARKPRERPDLRTYKWHHICTARCLCQDRIRELEAELIEALRQRDAWSNFTNKEAVRASKADARVKILMGWLEDFGITKEASEFRLRKIDAREREEG